MTAIDLQTPASDSAPLPTINPGAYRLDHLGVIEAQGEQAAAFLHNMITQDVLLQPVLTVRLASLCSPKGRMLASGWLLRLAEDRFAWVVRRDVLEPTLKRLKMFQLRMKLTLRDATPTESLVGLISAEAHTGRVALTQGGWEAQIASVAGLQLGFAAGRSASESTLADPSLWLLAEVLTGIGQVQAATVEAFVPQMLNHESVEGVNFKKGCYPGQEVVARSQFRGAIKRRAGIFFAPEVRLAAGDPLHADDAERSDVGVVAQAAHTRDGTWLIACVQTAALEGASPPPIGQGALLKRVALPYAIKTDL